MAAPTPTTEPDVLIAGDTAKWLKTLAEYPATEGWELSYVLINGTSKITVIGTASGSDHLITVAATTTADWVPGDYTWRARVSKSGEVYTVGSGTFKVQSSFSAATLDARTHARRVLANIEAYLEDGANLTAANYTIAGRSLQRIPMAELLALRDRYRAEVARETAANLIARGMGDPRRVFVRFGGNY
ncbi:hypothetical protein AEP_00524 [Curvibacter sp. AEP1-3]|uniref:hypothetical protein n=1 Tax=Curvibacter sp. AEP1-3 TaxID=1844971 RepID=UPI000B3C3C74|nr:hypothetical protein [Curvibacter sp. AEP1-3]ARV17484.1 hypothetical protein AEP_00524 [Curvibacter sp. AEP1-3]